jgi:hypothetical protein
VNLTCSNKTFITHLHIWFLEQVTGVGTHTEWGQVMAAISHDNGEETPLQVNFNFVTELHFQIWFQSVFLPQLLASTLVE